MSVVPVEIKRNISTYQDRMEPISDARSLFWGPHAKLSLTSRSPQQQKHQTRLVFRVSLTLFTLASLV